MSSFPAYPVTYAAARPLAVKLHCINLWQRKLEYSQFADRLASAMNRFKFTLNIPGLS